MTFRVTLVTLCALFLLVAAYVAISLNEYVGVQAGVVFGLASLLCGWLLFAATRRRGFAASRLESVLLLLVQIGASGWIAVQGASRVMVGDRVDGGIKIVLGVSVALLGVASLIRQLKKRHVERPAGSDGPAIQ